MRLFIHTVNREYHARDNGAEYDTLKDALRAGIKVGITIAGDEVSGGADSAAVEVRVEREDGTVCERSIVSVAAASLLADAPERGARSLPGPARAGT